MEHHAEHTAWGVRMHLASATPANSRHGYDGFISPSHAASLASLLSRPEDGRRINHSELLFSRHLYHMAHAPRAARTLFLATRARMLAAARAHYRRDVWPHTTSVALRLPGVDAADDLEYGAGLHADNCTWSATACVPSTCCHMRAFSMVLFLNECEGGQFVFATRAGKREEVLTPRAGSLILFTSGPENLHGVLRVRGHTARTTMYMWLTTQQSLAEREMPWMALPAEEQPP